MGKITFQNWLRWVFDHPITKPEWYRSKQAEKLDINFGDSLLFVTKLFENPRPLLARFTKEQIAEGIFFIVDDMTSGHMYTFVDRSIYWRKRKRAIRSIFSLFDKVFDVYCSPHLSHLNEKGSPLNGVCYMWWDISLVRGFSSKQSDKKTDLEIMKVISRTLRLKSQACHESALHGLGHLFEKYPRKVETMVDNFLAKRKDIRPELKEYALRARRGAVM
jgi:hypothetical protein